VLNPALDVLDDLAGVALEPLPIEGLGYDPKLHDEVGGEVLGLDLASLFLPEPKQGCFIIAHNDPGI
jgi:hypothetical protein